MLDEVQMLADFEEVLNSLLHIENVDIYVTGSNSSPKILLSNGFRQVEETHLMENIIYNELRIRRRKSKRKHHCLMRM